MVDETKKPETPAYNAFPDPNRVPVVFVNELIGAGFLNGVVNLTFATAQFTPLTDGSVEVDPVVSSRLRMDLVVAQHVHEQLGRILKDQTVPATPVH